MFNKSILWAFQAELAFTCCIYTIVHPNVVEVSCLNKFVLIDQAIEEKNLDRRKQITLFWLSIYASSFAITSNMVFSNEVLVQEFLSVF